MRCLLPIPCCKPRLPLKPVRRPEPWLHAHRMVLAMGLLLTSCVCLAQEDQPPQSGDSSMPLPVAELAEAVVEDPSSERHSPSKAAWRAAVLPGWGQIYNKKYWKLPLVYGGLGGLGYWVSFNAVEHRRYRRSYIAKTDADAGIDDPFPALAESSVLSAREYYRRQLDASILLTVAFYSLQIVDAVVDAHLFEFDVSDDLSLTAEPWLPMGGAYGPDGFAGADPGASAWGPSNPQSMFQTGSGSRLGQAHALPSPQAAGIRLTLRLQP